MNNNAQPNSWMHDTLNVIGTKTLSEICIPGSHDSGMSTFGSHTLLASPFDTITQTNSILEQLNLGVRYFDIRPVISEGQYFTGHYSPFTEGGFTTWQGANCESIQNVINDLNTFTEKNNELVILYLSHSADTDSGNSSYPSFTQKQWEGLFSLLSGVNDLFYHTNDIANTDLTKIPINYFIDKGAAVIIVLANADIELRKGFFNSKNFNLFNIYSDTDDLYHMIGDQIVKMENNRHNYFLLSWTLTQQLSDIVERTSIIDLANKANYNLSSILKPILSVQLFPNIICIDNVVDSAVAYLSMWINDGCR